MAGWLEQHPLVAGDPDVPGNANEPLPALIRRVRSMFGPASGANAVALEAQVWGFELGGFYRFLGGLPPISDLMTAGVVVQPGPQTAAPVAGDPPRRTSIRTLLRTITRTGWWATCRQIQRRGSFFAPPGANPAGKRACKRQAVIRVFGLSAPGDAAGQIYSWNTLPGGYIPYWPGQGIQPVQNWTTLPDGWIPYWPGERSQPVQNWTTLPGGYIPYWPGQGILPAQEPLFVFDFAGSQSRLTAALESLWAQGITPSITTDPLYPNFDRFRFRGHRIQGADGTWQDAIPYDFPPVLRAFLTGRVDTAERRFRLLPGLSEATTWLSQAKVSSNGWVWRENALSPFYQLRQHGICPTHVVEPRYLDGWLANGSGTGVLDFGARLIEFMKHHFAMGACYSRAHQHIEPQPPASAPYDNVIGHGPWYVQRVQAMLARVHGLGQVRNPAFTLTNEGICNEHLVACFDEFYGRNSSAAVFNGDTRSAALRQDDASVPLIFVVPFFQYVFSELITAKMDMLDNDVLSHAGYKEGRITSEPPVARPAAMLDPALDERLPSLAEWRDAATRYFGEHFAVACYGLAPRNYARPGGVTTYLRGVAQTMNLRSKLFRISTGAVMGERVLLPAAWIEPPYDYNTEVVALCRARRAHAQALCGVLPHRQDARPGAGDGWQPGGPGVACAFAHLQRYP